MSTPQFVSERITPEQGSFDLGALARGEPGVPAAFLWRGQRFAVARVLASRRQLGQDRGDRYVRRHYHEVETSDGVRMRLYFERNPSDRSKPKQWWLYTLSPPEPAIVTQRLQLRRWTFADRDAFFRMVQDPDVMAHVHDFVPLSDAQAQAALASTIERYPEGYGDWAIVEPASGDILGESGLTALAGEGVEITWLLFPRYRGKGYALEAAAAVERYAFDTLAIARVIARVRQGNDRSVRVAEKLGMRLARRFCDERGEEMLEYEGLREPASLS